MKKVRKKDLENLITQLYYEFFAMDSENENNDISIKINSIYIYVIVDNEFESESYIRGCMRRFVEQIEAITFGNLKVTHSDDRIEGDTFLLRMYIANAYEIL